MDYEGLVNALRSYRLMTLDRSMTDDALTDAADAIETLLAERDAAQKQAQDLQIQWDMYGGDEGVTVALQKAEERDEAVKSLKKFGCVYCKHSDVSVGGDPCRDCCLIGGRKDNWQWRGTQKEGESDGQA